MSRKSTAQGFSERLLSLRISQLDMQQWVYHVVQPMGDLNGKRKRRLSALP